MSGRGLHLPHTLTHPAENTLRNMTERKYPIIPNAVKIGYGPWANEYEYCARCSRGVRMYRRKAGLDQRPSAWMTDSGIPA